MLDRKSSAAWPARFCCEMDVWERKQIFKTSSSPISLHSIFARLWGLVNFLPPEVPQSHYALPRTKSLVAPWQVTAAQVVCDQAVVSAPQQDAQQVVGLPLVPRGLEPTTCQVSAHAMLSSHPRSLLWEPNPCSQCLTGSQQ